MSMQLFRVGEITRIRPGEIIAFEPAAMPTCDYCGGSRFGETSCSGCGAPKQAQFEGTGDAPNRPFPVEMARF